MNLKLLCDAAEIGCPSDYWNDEVEQITSNSARVSRNTLFVCVRGLTVDGHRFIAEAVAAGARWVIVEEGCAVDQTLDVLYLKTKNARSTLAYLFDAWYGFPCRNLKMIGVTGTNGKTTVTHMIAHILTQAGACCGLIGTVGAKIGDQRLETDSHDPLANMTTPDPEVLFALLGQMRQRGAAYVVMEISSHSLALEKVAPIRFEIGIFTNLTPEHLDFHADMDDYAEAKAKLFAQSRISIIHADSPYASRMIGAARGRVATCSCKNNSADYFANDVQLDGINGVSYRLCDRNGDVKIHSPIAGAFTVSNSMQAVICAMLLGIDEKNAASAIASLNGVAGRMELIPLPEGTDFSVLIDYAHTPDALKNLLIAVRAMKKDRGRVVLLFGCGGDRDKTKRPMMGRIASELADYVILTSDNSRSEEREAILRDILAGYSLETPCSIFYDRREAIIHAVFHAMHDDIIVLAGKGHEEYEIDLNGKRAFSERKIVLEVLEEKRLLDTER